MLGYPATSMIAFVVLANGVRTLPLVDWEACAIVLSLKTSAASLLFEAPTECAFFPALVWDQYGAPWCLLGG